jgi:hypothetical protein
LLVETVRRLEPQSLLIYGGKFAANVLKGLDLPEVTLLPSIGEMRTTWKKTHKPTRDLGRLEQEG